LRANLCGWLLAVAGYRRLPVAAGTGYENAAPLAITFTREFAAGRRCFPEVDGTAMSTALHKTLSHSLYQKLGYATRSELAVVAVKKISV
jgi:hypothetical protein